MKKIILLSMLVFSYFFTVFGNEDIIDFNDSLIKSEIMVLLKKELDLPLRRINVFVDEGNVRITGSTDTRLQYNLIVEKAVSIRGVKGIDVRDLDIVSSKQFFKDSFLTARVKGKLLQMAHQKIIAKDYNFKIETKNGVVYITGEMSDIPNVPEMKNQLEKINGVKAVRVNIIPRTLRCSAKYSS